eukprot:72124-Rhodomonas_salina.1
MTGSDIACHVGSSTGLSACEEKEKATGKFFTRGLQFAFERFGVGEWGTGTAESVGHEDAAGMPHRRHAGTTQP